MIDEIYQVINLDSIIVGDRHRKIYRHVEELAESIEKRGQLYPMILDQDMNLCEGGRRLAALRFLDKKEGKVLIKNSLEEIDRKEIELIGNIDRDDFTWQEKVSLVKNIHDLWKEKDSLWSGRKTALRIGKSKSLVANWLKMADMIESIPELTSCKTEVEAWKAIGDIEETLVLREIAERKDVDKTDTKDLISRAALFLDEAKKERDPNGSPVPDAAELGLPVPDPVYEGDDGTPFEGYEPEHKGEQAALANAGTSKKYENFIVGDFFENVKKVPDEYLSTGSIIECDPPYGIDLKNIKKNPNASSMDSYNEIDEKEYPGFLQMLIEDCFRVMGNDSTLFFWYAAQWYQDIIDAMKSAGFSVNPVPAVWIKTGTGHQSNNPKYLLANGYEHCLIARKGKPGLGRPGANNVYIEPVVPIAKKIHTTERPVALMREMIKDCCIISGKTVCMVPFLGSGSTLNVCEELGFEAFGFDLSEEHKHKYIAKKEGLI